LSSECLQGYKKKKDAVPATAGATCSRTSCQNQERNVRRQDEKLMSFTFNLRILSKPMYVLSGSERKQYRRTRITQMHVLGYLQTQKTELLAHDITSILETTNDNTVFNVNIVVIKPVFVMRMDHLQKAMYV
jgi:hypothetical protein